MTERQRVWRMTAELLRKNECSLRDGVDLSKLTPEEKKERSAQIVFESQIVQIPMGNTEAGKRKVCAHK